MSSSTSELPSSFAARCRTLLSPRQVIFHDGRGLRRVSVGGAAQGAIAVAGAALIGFAGYGASHMVSAPGEPAHGTRIVKMERQLAGMQARVAKIRATAQVHAERIEQRQALLNAALTGAGEKKQLALAALRLDPAGDRLTAHAIAPLLRVEQRQGELAALANDHLAARYTLARRELKKLGVSGRIATGGPLIEAGSAEARANLNADAQFRSLFMTWKKLDRLEQGTIAIPSVQPVEKLTFTSNFGIRSDPFRGTAAMHAGVDIPGPTGTPIYATADGIVAHAARQGGYGNMVEINHGKGIATRYGHLSKIIVSDNTRVRRGQIIGLLGSTGRSTGPHLHYEVRMDGHAVNPVPFLTTGDYLLAAQDRAVKAIPVSTGGPAPQD
ncbi:peptidase M23 [Sphingomonas sp. Leaf412]|uniref:M23 family metallopeptidase n=1 Tax=Sphingomonas sp. Leaf412 TaxID=1736370 RepID=UPI000700BEAC|nr:M23 family metallopeptidase [Sphingomonas sp. Leaf412]KQT31194.1 peptidase M23 [Sphingomonas sp. Leaf412]